MSKLPEEKTLYKILNIGDKDALKESTKIVDLLIKINTFKPNSPEAENFANTISIYTRSVVNDPDIDFLKMFERLARQKIFQAFNKQVLSDFLAAYPTTVISAEIVNMKDIKFITAADLSLRVDSMWKDIANKPGIKDLSERELQLLLEGPQYKIPDSYGLSETLAKMIRE